MAYHLAFDLGAESGRAVVGELKNGKICLTEIHRFETGIINLNKNYYCSVINCYKEVMESLRIYKKNYNEELTSMGACSWGCDYGLLDNKNRLLSIPFSYRDSRVNDTLKIIESAMGTERLYELTGVQMLPINTLNQLIGMKKTNDKTLDICENMLFVGDLIHFFLTGNIYTEHTMLSISQIYNNISKDYEDEIFECFGINKKIKTQIIYPGQHYGRLRQDLCDEIGMKSVAVITPAVHDTASGFAAVPCVENEKWCAISSGTWSILGAELDEVVINEDTYNFNLSNSAGVFNKNLLLKNVMGLWIIQRCKKQWNIEYPNLTYEDILNLAKKAKSFHSFIEPDDLAFFNPENMIDAIFEYIEKTNQPHTDVENIGQIARIVYESLAMKYKYVMNKIENATKKVSDVIYVIGGGIKNTMLNQFSANALNKHVKTGSSEACTMGNLLMQCYGLGLVDSLEELRTIVKNSINEEEFSPEDVKIWEKEYQRFLQYTLL